MAGYMGMEWTKKTPLNASAPYPMTVLEWAFELDALPLGSWSFQAIIS